MHNPSTSNLPFPVEPGHERQPVAGWLLSAAGHAGMYILYGGWLAGFLVAIELWGELVGLAVSVVTILLVFLILPVLVGFVARGRQMRATPAGQLLGRYGCAPVVLLRSFNDDDLIDPTFTATYRVVPGRYENRLVTNTGVIAGGPYAIGLAGGVLISTSGAKTWERLENGSGRGFNQFTG